MRIQALTNDRDEIIVRVPKQDGSAVDHFISLQDAERLEQDLSNIIADALGL